LFDLYWQGVPLQTFGLTVVAGRLPAADKGSSPIPHMPQVVTDILLSTGKLLKTMDITNLQGKIEDRK
jgi:hypothetical protein